MSSPWTADGILRQVAAYHPDPRQRDLADRASLAVRNARLVRELEELQGLVERLLPGRYHAPA